MKTGTRVLAIKSADATHAYIFGYGTYDGDHPCPLMKGGAMDAVTADQVREIMKQQTEEMKGMLDHDMIPNEEGRKIANAIIAEYEGCTPEDFVKRAEEFNAKYANPEGQLNPRITLDSGEVVWGCMCWWGEAEKFDAKIAGLERVTVPVPTLAELTGEDEGEGGEPEIPDELDAEAELEAAADGEDEDADHIPESWQTVDTSMED